MIALTPGLAFGHYNLGHTLFLQGRYQAALGAYLEGQWRDPERNPVQGQPAGVVSPGGRRSEGALADLERSTARVPSDHRRHLLADSSAIADRSDLARWREVNDWRAGELAKLA